MFFYMFYMDAVRYAGSEPRVLWYLQCRHRLPVDWHHRCETWKLHPQGLLEIPDETSWDNKSLQGDAWKHTATINIFFYQRQCCLFIFVAVLLIYTCFMYLFLFFTGQCKSTLSSPRKWLQQQHCAMWRSLHWQLRLPVRLSHVNVSNMSYVTNISLKFLVFSVNLYSVSVLLFVFLFRY